MLINTISFNNLLEQVYSGIVRLRIGELLSPVFERRKSHCRIICSEQRKNLLLFLLHSRLSLTQNQPKLLKIDPIFDWKMDYLTLKNQGDDKPIFLGSLFSENYALGNLKMSDGTVSENLDGFCHCMLL